MATCVIKRASITVYPQELEGIPTGICSQLYVNTELQVLLTAKSLWPDIREFTREDWYGFAGASNLPSGNPPQIVELEDGSIVIVAGHEEWE